MSTQNIGFMDPAAWSAVLEYPLAEPPKGIIPNYEHPHFYGAPVVIISAICLPLLVVVLGLRVYAKACIVKRFTPDDYVYFISWPAGVAFICLSLVIASGGAYGYHAWEVKIGDLSKTIIIRSQVLAIMGGPLSWLMRLALFSLIWFAFAPLKWTKKLVLGGVIVSGTIYCIPAITNGIVCRPRGGTDQVAYIAGMASMQCADTRGIAQRMSIMTGVLNVIVDFYILLIPIPAIRKLQVSKHRRIGIYVVFLAAIGGCLTSVVVLIFRVRFLGNQDITYAVVPIFTINIIEFTVGLIIPCAASFSAVWRHFRSGQGSSTTTGSEFRNLRSGISGRTEKSTVDLVNEEPNNSTKKSWDADDSIVHHEMYEMRAVPTSNP